MFVEDGILVDVSNEDLVNLNNPKLFWQGVKTIDKSTFCFCDVLTQITLPNTLEKIGFMTFNNLKNLNEVLIENGVKIIDEFAFSETGIKNIIIPNSVESIGESAFKKCLNLQNVVLSNNIKEIPDSVFYGCKNLENVTLPENLKEIGLNAFSGCEKLTNLKLPNNIIKIEAGAFCDCLGLENIVFPKSLSEVKSYAFEGCKNLKTVTILNNNMSLEENAFKGCNCDVFIHLNGNSFIKVKSYMFSCCSVYAIKQMHMQGKVLSRFDKILKDLNLDPFNTSESTLTVLFNFCNALGLFEPNSVCIKDSVGNEIPVSSIASTIVRSLFIGSRRYNKQLDVKNIAVDLCKVDSFWLNKSCASFNQEFLKFMSKSILNVSEYKNSIYKAYKWFETRKNLNIEITNKVQKEGTTPTILQNRYKIYHNYVAESGIIKHKWGTPTFDYILKEMSSSKYLGIQSEKDKEIANELLKFDVYKDQSFFDKAKEINSERERLEKMGVLENTIVKGYVSKKLKSAFEKYKQSTDEIEEKIINNLEYSFDFQKQSTKACFEYELLPKDSVKMFTLGLYANCCCNLFDAGAGAQRAAIVHPDLQVLTIKNDKGEIAAFSILYFNRQKGYIVCNDLEISAIHKIDASEVKEIYNKYKEGVIAVAKQYNKENPNKKQITQINTGLAPNFEWINALISKNPKAEERDILKAVDFSQYQYLGSKNWRGDWHDDQYILWSEKDDGKQ